MEDKTCARKIRYQDSSFAKRMAVALHALRKTAKLYVYRCPSCDGWHLTKMPQKKGRYI